MRRQHAGGNRLASAKNQDRMDKKSRSNDWFRDLCASTNTLEAF